MSKALAMFVPLWLLSSGVQALAIDPATATAVEKAQRACEHRVDTLAQEIDSATFWRAFLTVVGAAIAAVGSAIAGFASKRVVRKVTALVGALGAIVASLPALVPESGAMARDKKLSEQHKLFADKVWVQVPTFQTPSYVNECTRYTLSRYASCASAVPEETVPPLPEPPDSLPEQFGSRKSDTDAVQLAAPVQPAGTVAWPERAMKSSTDGAVQRSLSPDVNSVRSDRPARERLSPAPPRAPRRTESVAPILQ